MISNLNLIKIGYFEFIDMVDDINRNLSENYNRT